MTAPLKDTNIQLDNNILTKEQQIEKYGLEINKVYNEDCMIGMQRIKDKSIDMILCDLPYGTTQNKWDSVIPLNDYIEVEIKKKLKQLNQDEYFLYCYQNNIPLNEAKKEWKNNHKIGLWTHYNRIIKDNGAIVLFAAHPFTSILEVSNIKNFKYDWTWKKTKGTGHLNAKKQPLRDKEDILVFYKKQCTYIPQFTKGKPYDGSKRAGTKHQTSSYGLHGQHREMNDGKRYPRQVLDFDIVGRGSLHPTQKPIELLKFFINTYTKKEEIILDNCMGVGSTAIASLDLHRNYIGFELDKDYYEVSKDRIKNNG